MVGTIICLIVLCIVFILFGHISLNDSDYKDIVITRTDKIWFGIYMVVFAVIIIKLPIFPKIYASIALPMLLISAYTDGKIKLLYNVVFYILASLSVLLEILQANIWQLQTDTAFTFYFSAQTFTIIIFVVILELFNMYGNGDKGMAVVCGCTWYLLRPIQSGAECLLAECIMFLIAEIPFYLRAIKEKNLDGPFKLKESRPLGPDLLFSTTLVLIGGILLWGN